MVATRSPLTDHPPPPVLTGVQLTFPSEEFGPESEEGLLPKTRRVFCNRNLRLDQIEWIGFDMDYTLAIYEQDKMNELSIQATARKLVERGYPESLLTMRHRTDFAIRGLLVDKELGNVLKMDRYRYVKKAYHGLRELTRQERQELYSKRRLRAGTERYHWVDTLYALSEVSVFAAAVEELERIGEAVDYVKLFTDVRTCIDIAHQDGSILDHIMNDLPAHVIRDPNLANTLHKFRSAGKKLFLLTNSRPAYTDKMMTYLVGDARPEYKTWKHYFDVAICSATKPKFFTHTNPHLEHKEDEAPTPAASFERGKVYLGGNIDEFERMIGSGGDKVLYIGDHIFGDVLRAKKETAWRTTMIIQEMRDELTAVERVQPDIDHMDALLRARSETIEELARLQSRLRDLQKEIDHNHDSDPAASSKEARPDLYSGRSQYKKAIEVSRHRLAHLETELAEVEAGIDTAIHPFWGSLFKVGTELSSFGSQVETYACLYTDRVSNFLNYSSTHYFLSPRQLMAHEI